MRTAITLEVGRNAYCIEDVIDDFRPMTVGQLKAQLEEFDDDVYVLASNDNGYTYGVLNDMHFYEQPTEEYDFEQVW